jgi:hypothetical protein
MHQDLHSEYRIIVLQYLIFVCIVYVEAIAFVHRQTKIS